MLKNTHMKNNLKMDITRNSLCDLQEIDFLKFENL